MLKRYDPGMTGSTAFGAGVDMFHHEKGEYVKFKDVELIIGANYWSYDDPPVGNILAVRHCNGVDLAVYCTDMLYTSLTRERKRYTRQQIMEWRVVE